jgi:hypothetical protein
MSDASSYVPLATAIIGLLAALVTNFDKLTRALKKTRKRFPQLIHKSKLNQRPARIYIDGFDEFLVAPRHGSESSFTH